MAAGDLVLRIPEHLVITLNRVFEDEVCSLTALDVLYLCIEGAAHAYWLP